LDRIYDAIWIAVEQVRDKDRQTLIIVLTDGEDNASKHSHVEVLEMIKQYPYYALLCQDRGKYNVIDEQNLLHFSIKNLLANFNSYHNFVLIR
jgi:Mg-chelatase subunit ChlD